MQSKKLTENELLSVVANGKTVLDCLRVVDQIPQLSKNERLDAAVELELIADKTRFCFAAEAKTDSGARSLDIAIMQVRKYAGPDRYPLVIVPYLSLDRLNALEADSVSGIDLCGNGVIIIPGRLYVRKTGEPNQYPDTRALNNPYRGRSAMVARMLLERPRWASLNKLQAAIVSAGTPLSISQTSKAVQALEDDLIVSKSAGAIVLQEPEKVLDRLGHEWKNTTVGKRRTYRSPKWIEAFSYAPRLQWAVTGESSAVRYGAISQMGPRQVAVTDLDLADSLLRGRPEPIPNYADIELIETIETGYYFQNELDKQGMRWASRLQTWLELQAGDGRQQDAAKQIRQQILREVKP